MRSIDEVEAGVGSLPTRERRLLRHPTRHVARKSSRRATLPTARD